MLIALLTAWMLQSAPPPVGVEIYRSEKGLNANALYGVLVDPNGFVWVHTDNGLYRYDGNSFKVAPSTLGREVVLANLVDSTTIAALSFDNTIDLIDIRRLSDSQILSIPDSIKLNSFASTVRRFGDTLYVGTSERRVLRKVGEEWRNYIIPRTSNHFIHDARVAMFERIEGGVLTVSSGGSWFMRETHMDADVDSTYIAGKPSHSARIWWMPGKFQLYKLDSKGLTPSWTFGRLGVKGFVHQVLWRSENELWLATKEEGLVKLVVDGVAIRKQILLDLNDVSGLAMSADGSIWVTTLRNGLYRFHPWFDRFESLERIAGVPLERTVFTSDHVVATEYNGAFFKQRNGTYQRILDGPIHFAELISDGSAVVGQIDKAFTISTSGRLTDLEQKIRNSGNVLQHPIKAAYSTNNHIALSAPNGVFKLSIENDSLIRVFPGRATAVVLLDENRIAVGRPNRLDILRRTNGELISTRPFRVTSMARLDSKRVLIGTNGDGLLAYDVEADVEHTVLPGAWSTLHRLNERMVAIVGSAGLFVLELDQQVRKSILKEIPLTPTGSAQQVRHVRLTNEGELWISTSNGILISKLSDIMRYEPVSRLRISEIEHDGTQRIPTDTLDVPQYTQRISLSLAILGAHNQSLHRLEYLPHDSDSSWIALSQPSIEIESIRKGHTTFTFRLRNVLTDEVLSSVSLVVHKAPFWWERPWVIALGLILGILTTVALTTLALRRSHRKKMDELAQEDRVRELERVAITRLLTSHYLFNALATIRSVARRSTDEVNSYIGRLSKVIRALIDRTSQNEVDLRSELDWIHDYVALESVGRQLALRFDVAIDDKIDPEDVVLPAFILQPIVENAMFHGAMHQDPIIRCDIRNIDNRLHIFIRNRIEAGSAAVEAHGSPSKGLSFMTERLKGWGRYHGLHLETDDVLRIRQTETEWTIEVILPLVNHDLPLVARS